MMAQSELSNSSSLFLLKAKQLNSDAEGIQSDAKEKALIIKEIKANFPVSRKKGNFYIGGLMKVDENFNEEALTDLGGKVGTRNPILYTFRIPIEQFEAMTNLPGISYIQVDQKVKKKLDAALAETNVTAVHLGTNLPQAYTGEGVVVGVIDGGFDMTHPAFRDSSGNLRIQRVWVQNVNAGNPPSAYGYGTELTDAADMLSIGQTSDSQSHGTHVTSIAAGRGVGLDEMFGGVAPNADIVIVEPDFSTAGESAITDGISYIFNYADSVGKPAVINMSLGHHSGPHDGTSLFDQFIDAIVGEGKILVGSVSNEGDRPVHIAYDLQANDTLRSFIGTYSTEGSGEVSIWGQPGASFDVSMKFDDFSTGSNIGTTAFLPSSADTTVEIVFAGGDITISIDVDDASVLNSKPNIMIMIEMSALLSQQVVPELILTGTAGSLHLWSEVGLESFGIGGYTEGNSDISCNEIGGTADGIISVGAYTTKTSFMGLDGNTHDAQGTVLGELGAFSSHGPTVDGRTKPEITAPGDVLIAAVNATYPYVAEEYPPAYEYQEGNTSWYFGGATGTSMSSPFVAGIVALLLEANDTLNVTQVKEILATTARTDSLTGTIPPGGSNLWGWGKVDALAAIQELETYSTEDILKNNRAVQIFPNPTSASITVFFENKKEDVMIQITDISGKLVWSENWSDGCDYAKNIDLSSFKAGIYFLSLRDNENIITSKIVKY